MIAIIKNNIYRFTKHKGAVIFFFFLLIIALTSAIFITNRAEIKGNIALITSTEPAPVIESDFLNIEILTEHPKKSSLVRGIYDAIVTINGTEIKVETLKDDDFKKNVTALLTHPELIPKEDPRVKKIGSNILGYMLLFILFQGLSWGEPMSEDKEKKILPRISTTPLSFLKYILGHMIFIFGILFIQVYFIITVTYFLGIKIGFSLGQYAYLIALICLLAVAISSLLNTFFKTTDSYLMFGSSFITLSSILTGSFSNFAKTETFLNKLLYIFPQKNYIKFIDGVERGNLTTTHYLQLGYLIAFIVIATTLAIIKIKKDYEYHAT